jgi:hypothetical protein
MQPESICRMISRRVLAFIVVLLAAHPHGLAQRVAGWGVDAGYDWDLHSGKFAKLEQLPFCCPSDISSFSGGSMYAGLRADINPLRALDGVTSLVVGVGLRHRWADATQQSLSYINDPRTNRAVEGSIDYVMNFRHNELFIDLAPKIHLFHNASFIVGLRFAYNLSSNVTMREQLADNLVADGYYFIDPLSGEKSTTRNEYDGALSQALPYNISYQAALSYDIATNSSSLIAVSPSLWYRYQPRGFTDALVSRTANGITSGASWTMHSVGVSVAVSLINQRDTEVEHEPAPVPQQAVPPCHKLEAGIAVAQRCGDGSVAIYDPVADSCKCPEIRRPVPTRVAINGVYPVRNGAWGEKPVREIFVRRTRYARFMPLVNLIVFNAGSSNIDVRNSYIDRGATSGRRVELDSGFATSYQRNVLNMLGQAYIDKSVSKITLVGIAAEDEMNGEELADERCLQVREYLYRRWNVPYSNVSYRRATLEEQAGIRESMPTLSSRGIVLLFKDTSNMLVDYVQIQDTRVSVIPDTIGVSAEVSIPNASAIAEAEWQFRIGGVPNVSKSPILNVRRVIDQSQLSERRSTVTLSLIDENEQPKLALQELQLVQTAKLIPSLRVKVGDSVFNAQRMNSTSVIPVRVDSSIHTPNHTSSPKMIVGMFDVDPASLLGTQQASSLAKMLSIQQASASEWEVSSEAKRLFEVVVRSNDAGKQTQDRLNLANMSNLIRGSSELRSHSISGDALHGLSVTTAFRIGMRVKQ